MKNSDLKRFYKGSGIDPKDFVRLGQDGKIPGDLLPETGPTILELSNVSGTLTDEQYELASGDNCIITLGTQRYYKMYDAATLIVYQTATRQAGQDSALYEYIEITKATKAWEYKNDNIVAANPTLEGTEAELTGIQIGNTKYKAGGNTIGGNQMSQVITIGTDVQAMITDPENPVVRGYVEHLVSSNNTVYEYYKSFLGSRARYYTSSSTGIVTYTGQSGLPILGVNTTGAVPTESVTIDGVTYYGTKSSTFPFYACAYGSSVGSTNVHYKKTKIDYIVYRKATNQLETGSADIAAGRISIPGNTIVQIAAISIAKTEDDIILYLNSRTNELEN